MHASVAVDASVSASRLMPQDVHHTSSLLWSNRYLTEGGIVAVPEFLLIELSAALVRQTKQPTLAKQSARSLYNSPLLIVPVDASLTEASVDLAADLQLKAGDAIYVALAHRMGIPLISWDNEQLQRSSSLIETYTPDSYPF